MRYVFAPACRKVQFGKPKGAIETKERVKTRPHFPRPSLPNVMLRDGFIPVAHLCFSLKYF